MRLWRARIVAMLASGLGIGSAAFVYWRIEPVATMLAPAIISALPLLGFQGRSLRNLCYTAAFFMAVVAFLGWFSVGMVFVPSAVLWVVAAVLAGKSESKGDDHRRSRG